MKRQLGQLAQWDLHAALTDAAQNAERGDTWALDWELVQDMAEGRFRIGGLASDVSRDAATGAPRVEYAVTLVIGEEAPTKRGGVRADCPMCAHTLCDLCGPRRPDLTDERYTLVGVIDATPGQPPVFLGWRDDAPGALPIEREFAAPAQLLSEALVSLHQQLTRLKMFDQGGPSF